MHEPIVEKYTVVSCLTGRKVGRATMVTMPSGITVRFPVKVRRREAIRQAVEIEKAETWKPTTPPTYCSNEPRSTSSDEPSEPGRLLIGRFGAPETGSTSPPPVPA